MKQRDLSKNKINNYLSHVAFSIIISIFIISCGGCRSSKVSNKMKTGLTDITSETIQSNKKTEFVKSLDNENIIIVNDSTKIVNNVLFTYSSNKNETRIILPNGTKMSSNENVFLFKDIPQNAFKKDHNNVPFIDLFLVSNSVKKRLFGNMACAETIKIENLKSVGYDNNITICGDNNNYICKYTTMYVRGHDEISEDNYIGWGVGQIGFTEIYNLNGEKIVDLNRYKNGGYLKTLNESINLIIYQREGDDEGNFYGYLWPVIDVYNFTNGKQMCEVRTFGYSGEVMIKNNKICVYSGHLKEGNTTCFYIIDYKNEHIYFYKYKFGEPSVVTIENDNILLTGGAKININNSAYVLKMGSNAWNEYVKNMLSE